MSSNQSTAVGPFKTEQEIRDAGFAIDLPFEAGSADPKPILYADTDDEKRQLPEGLLDDWDLNSGEKTTQLGPPGEIWVAPHKRLGNPVKGFWRTAFSRKPGEDPIVEHRDRHPNDMVDGPVEVQPEQFYDFVNRFISNSEMGPYLSDYSIEDYKAMRTFVAYGGHVGGALKRHGDRVEIVSLFNDGGPRGSGMEMFDRLVKEGGNALDCLGDGLRKKYETRNFRVTETIEWDDKYAPEGWNYEKFGRPNVYVMELDKEGGENG